MVDDFKNKIELLFTGHESGLQLKEKLDVAAGLLNAVTDVMLPKQQRLFLEAVDKIVNISVKIIADKLLRTSTETDDVSRCYNHELICSCLAKLSSIVLQSISIYMTFQTFHLEYISRVFGPPLVKLFLIFDEKSFPGKNEPAIVSSLMTNFLQVMHMSSVRDYLDSISNSLYGKILKLFTAHLIRDVWKIYPMTCFAFANLISYSSGEKVSSTLSMILPPILLLIDDFQSKFVVLGSQMLKVIFALIPGGELRMHGWADVIYDALFKKLYHRNVAILDASLQCLLAVLKVVERDPQKADKQRSLTRYDDVLQLLISNLTMISDNQLLSILWKHLPSFIEVMGITTARHLKDLLELFKFHLEMGYLKHLPYIFNAIEVTVKVTWIRSKNFTAVLLKHLLKLALRIDLNGCNDEGVYDGIRRCISLLYQCNRSLVKTTITKLSELPKWSKGRLQQVIKLPFSSDCSEVNTTSKY